MKNALNWFEIPVTDFDRAKSFYEQILDYNMETHEMDGMKMAFFPSDWGNGIGGGLAHGEGCIPSDKVTLVYLNGGDDLSTPLGRVEAAGGQVVMPKTDIGSNGFMGLFMDTEGNKVAFHSNS